MDLERALTQASDENDLPVHYRDIVRPLLRQPREQWPQCCGSDCEPCVEKLKRVAERTLALMADG